MRMKGIEVWAEHILSNADLRRAAHDPRAISLNIRLNWSRSVPMSCVDEVRLTVDGEPVDPSSLTLAQGGEEHALPDWAPRDDIWWPVLEPAVLTVTPAHRLDEGEHFIELELRVRVPAFAPGPDGVWPTRFNRGSATAALR